MLTTDDACIQCSKSFPLNRDLAAVPAGRRLAFDPESQRVWRICTGCGHWNLLGPESATAVAAELHSRLAPTRSGSSVHEKIGNVEILTIATAADAPVVSKEGLHLRRWLNAGFRWRYLLKTVPYVGAIGGMLYEFIRDPTDPQTTGWQFLATLALGFGLGTDITRFFLRRPTHRWALTARLLATAALAFMVPTMVSATYFGTRLTMGLVAFGAVAMSILDLLLGLHSCTVTTGKRLHLSRLALRDVTLTVARGGPGFAAENLRGGLHAEGSEAAMVIRALDEGLLGKATPTETGDGWTLARIHGDVGQLLLELDRVRPDHAGAHHWPDLPTTWQVALLIAATEATGSTKERAVIQMKIAEASEVAAITESLHGE